MVEEWWWWWRWWSGTWEWWCWWWCSDDSGGGVAVAVMMVVEWWRCDGNGGGGSGGGSSVGGGGAGGGGSGGGGGGAGGGGGVVVVVVELVVGEEWWWWWCSSGSGGGGDRVVDVVVVVEVLVGKLGMPPNDSTSSSSSSSSSSFSSKSSGFAEEDSTPPYEKQETSRDSSRPPGAEYQDEQARVLGASLPYVLYGTPRLSMASDILRNCYEAFALYSFGSYLIACLGGERRVIELLEDESEKLLSKSLLEGAEDKPKSEHRTLRNFFLQPCVLGKDLLSIEKFGLVQYMILKTVCAFLALILELFGVYGDGEFKWYYGYPYIAVVLNFSQMWALYCLVQFYNVTHERLKPIKPLAKFISFKAIVFATWWQGVGIALLCTIGILPKEEKFQTGLQDFLICIEMAVAAVANHYITDNVLPRGGGFDRVTSFQSYLLYNIVKRNCLCLPYILLKEMALAGSTDKSLPFGGLLTLVFEHHGIDLLGEDTTRLKEPFNSASVARIGKKNQKAEHRPQVADTDDAPEPREVHMTDVGGQTQGEQQPHDGRFQPSLEDLYHRQYELEQQFRQFRSDNQATLVGIHSV
ncbi:hypothetical protein RHGRI_014535 [Rhododendron griersonianum]|uniref:Uncharacterized protein n=1 Tax=Rhododendron griersonianum TaxID=479676 RepID=A0AAV6KA55_9ERIC|nr:hypothetical protein RHGRI_014535 [Rhododendron griersonianum]